MANVSKGKLAGLLGRSGKPPAPTTVKRPRWLELGVRQPRSRIPSVSTVTDDSSTKPKLGSRSGVVIVTMPLLSSVSPVAVMSLLGVSRSRNAVPKIPWVLMVTRPPKLSVALAVISLSSSATRVSESMVMLPPEADSIELVVIWLPSRRTIAEALRVMLPCSPAAVAAVSSAWRSS